MKKEPVVSVLLFFAFLSFVNLFMFTPTVKAQPPIIGSTNVFGHSYQRYTFYANARFWAFYSDNTYIVYKTSTDGSMWSSATTVRGANMCPEFSVWFDGTYVHYAKGEKNQYENTSLFYRMGVPNANGTITWNAPEQIVAPAVENRSYRAPQIIIDSDGYPVITYLNKTTWPYRYALSVSKSSMKNGTWTEAAGFPVVVSTDEGWPFSVPLTNGKLYTMWTLDHGKIRGALFNGIDWGSAESCTSNFLGEDEHGACAVAYGDDVHLVYIGNETATKIYRYVNRTYGSGWGSETVVKNVTGAAGNYRSIGLTVDPSIGDLWMWFNTTDNKIAFRKYEASTSSWDTNDTYPFGESFTSPYYITTSYQVRNNKIPTYWREDTAIPYDLVFDYLAIETVPPNIGILSPENETYDVTEVPLNFTVDEPTSWIGYSLDGQANVTITGNTTLTGLSEEMHYVVVYAIDTAGNRGSSDTVYFTVDTLPPNIEILSPENKTYTVTEVLLIFTVSESTSWIGYSLDGQANVTIPGNTTLTGLSEGMHSLEVYAIDTAGNLGSSETVPFTVIIIIPPQILSPENKTYTTSSVPLNFTVDEPTSWIGYSLDGQANVTITGNTTLTGLSEGMHSLEVYANDTAGNMGSSETVLFTVVVIIPPQILSPENKTYTTSSVPLNFTVDEPTSWIGYSLDGQANVTITGNTTLTGLSEGMHSLEVYANDTAGNMGPSSTVYFTIDTKAPTIVIVSPENRTYTSTSVPLNFTISESTSWMGYSLDGAANITIPGNTTLVGLSDGSHSLIVYAKDMAGNSMASEMVYFSIKTKNGSPVPTLIVAAIVTGGVVGAALLVYFIKVKKKT